jgi:hypothetical protein
MMGMDQNWIFLAGALRGKMGGKTTFFSRQFHWIPVNERKPVLTSHCLPTPPKIAEKCTGSLFFFKKQDKGSHQSIKFLNVPWNGKEGSAFVRDYGKIIAFFGLQECAIYQGFTMEMERFCKTPYIQVLLSEISLY